jgi:hypothetical protein
LAARSGKWRSNQALNTSSIDPLRFENTPFLSHEAVVHLRLAPRPLTSFLSIRECTNDSSEAIP